ncbi:MAG TPA: inositol-3-phosphate synthase, partial [Longimicrobiales bacterium]
MNERPEIRPAQGRLGVLLPGFGAVATTFVAGVEVVRQGLSKPFGSLTQMQTIRIGKRNEGRTPLIKDFIDLANLDDLVFGAWDPIPDDGLVSAITAGVLTREQLDTVGDF